MTHTPRIRLTLVSALALFIELALIRYLGSEIRIFAYYKNLVLIACFLGFGVGFLRAAACPRWALSAWVMTLVTGLVNVCSRFDLRYGPAAATDALSNYTGSLTMGEQTVASVSDGVLLAGFAWALGLFVACLVVMYGFAQRIGADIEAFHPSERLQAYSWNVLGSLLGIAAFSGVSWLALGPIYWFVPALLATVPLLQGRRARGTALLAAPMLLLALVDAPGTIWSPYQRLQAVNSGPAHWAVTVNGTGYMSLASFAQPAAPGIDRWRLPHSIHPGAERVLVIGAGGGNDVSAALHAGAKRVVAVEIDPQILALGKQLHPDSPYSDPRVHVVIDDARHYGETTDERFDLIVFSHLDSHTALSGFTNVRLDNYIYTVESFRTFQRLLSARGALYVSFFSTRRWVAERLRENLRLAFAEPPVALYADATAVGASRAGFVLNAHFLASPSPQLRAAAERLRDRYFLKLEAAAAPPPSSDDWPYLFVEDRHVPVPMLILAVMLLLVSTLFTGFHVRGELRSGGSWPIDRQFFFLGAGFLLLEVHNVGRLARVFGTTWSVNAWVIAAVMGVILLANALVERWPRLCDVRAAYGGLVACLLACIALPVETVLAWPLAQLLVTALYTSPLLFAGIVFAQSFRGVAKPMRALGSNLLGSLLGGFLELASFAFGLSALLYVAALLYLLSYRHVPRAARSGTGPSQLQPLTRSV
jgi:spermidine synthase